MEATTTIGASAPTLDRNATIRRIRTALRKRSGRAWSVTGGRGTGWGWITIDAPPARRTWTYHLAPTGHEYVEINTYEPGGHTGPDDRADLARLLGLERVHDQGENIPASTDYRREYVDRAEGREPSVLGKPY